MNYKLYIIAVLCLSFFALNAQIVVDVNPPNNDPLYLVEQVLLGNGVTASNVVFSGELEQIGYIDGSASNIGMTAGIVMSTGEVIAMDPNQGAAGWLGPNTVTDPDLLHVSNIVPPLLGFTGPTAINDVAVLEFDFIPNSDELSFDFIFGSEEYFGFENTVFNDVFGFFLSGPGITGPYSSPAAFPNGSVNLAVVPGSNPVLPISISSINSVTPINDQFFIDNSNYTTVSGMDGFTVKLKAKAQVQCGETYHIRLAIADAQDQALDSYVLFGEKSFLSPSIDISNNLTNDDTTYLEIPCGGDVSLECLVSNGTFDFQWYENGILMPGETNNSITVGPGIYSLEANEVGGCSYFSDTIQVIEATPTLTLGSDYEIPCNSTTYIGATVYDGSPPFTYLWSNGSTANTIEVSSGNYDVMVTDYMGCIAYDTIIISSPQAPEGLVSGGGYACADGTQVDVVFDFIGTPPYNFIYSDGNQQYNINGINTNQYILSTNNTGTYSFISLDDANCNGIFTGSANVELKPLPIVNITGGGIICPFDSVKVSVQIIGNSPFSFDLYNGLYNVTYDSLNSNLFEFYSNNEGVFSISDLTDGFGCKASELNGSAVVSVHDLIDPYILTTVDTLICAVDEPIQLETVNPGGKWYGLGVDVNNIFHPQIAGVGEHWLYYVMESNCQEIDSILIEVDCHLQVFIPNTFTPNGDEHNDVLEISAKNVLMFSFSIYSRWGEELFSTKNKEEFWDGSFKNKIVPIGIYTYNLKAYGKDAQFVSKTGTINVIK